MKTRYVIENGRGWIWKGDSGWTRYADDKINEAKQFDTLDDAISVAKDFSASCRILKVTLEEER